MVVPLDKFVVIKHTLLNDSDRLSLTLLYQPIVGSVAISFYLTLWANTDYELSNHYDLINSMQIKLDDLCLAREKLEAIGLIKTYCKEVEINEFVYELYSPLAVADFVNNPVLETALFNNIGSKAYQKVMDKFACLKIDLSSYKDISKSFKEVFAFATGERINQQNLCKIKYLGIDFEPTINLQEVLNLIPNELINLRKITNDIKTLIYQLALVYDLDDDEIRNNIINALSVDKTIDKEALKENCRNYYRFENKGKVPGIIYRNQPLAFRNRTGELTNRDLMIRDLEETTPYDFLRSRNNGSEPTKSDLRLVEYLLTEQNLKPGVVNALLDYVLKINNNRLTKTFVEQISTQWVRSNISTVADALTFAENEYNKKNNKKTITPKVPEWLGKEIKEELMSEEELKVFKDKLGVGNK